MTNGCSKSTFPDMELLGSRDLENFHRISTWIFDLDNTLYPAHCNLFAQVDLRMGEFISKRFGISRDEARHMQKRFYRKYGTTLRGLMTNHGVPPHEFLDYVHDIDLSAIDRDEELCAAIAALPGRKYIFTNGTRQHAENVAGRIGVLAHFDDVFDIAAGNYVPKPHGDSYAAFLDRFSAHGRKAAMFEDLSRNLTVPAELGMVTVLVRAREGTHPDAAIEGLRPDEHGPHVHFSTDHLTGFLEAIVAERDTRG